jgi:PAS domain S-box-containing protein
LLLPPHMIASTQASPSSIGRALFQGAALLLAYAVAAWVGLRFATLAGAASQLFPAAGVGLAGLILGGSRLWPAVFGGAIAAACLADLPLPWWVRIGMAAGNAAGTVCAAMFARRLRFSPAIQRLSDVLILAAVAAVLATIAAGVGTVLIRIAVGINDSTLLTTFWRWWAGDMAGILVVAPPALAWSSVSRSQHAAVHRHCVISIVFSLASAYALFGPWASSMPRAFLTIPALVWPAVAGGVRGASVALFGVASIVVWGSLRGYGPFGAVPDIELRMTLVQEFIAAAAGTLLVLAVASDERRHARRRDQLAAELHASEARLRAIVDATPECVKIVDADGRIEFMNDAGHRIVGLDSPAAGCVIGPIIAEEDRAAWMQMHEDVCRGMRRQIRYAVVRTDGVRRVVDCIAVPIRTRDGRPGQLSISRDVTQQQQADAALRLSEERFRGLFGALPLGIGVASCYGKILVVNPSFCQLVGYTEQELIGQTYQLYTHPEDLAPNVRLTDAFRANEAPNGYSIEKRYIRKDGQLIWVRVTARPYTEAGATERQILFMVEDITERRVAEQVRNAVESRLRAILDITPGLFWICDAQGVATYISPRWEAYTGQSAEEALGRGWTAVIHPDDLARVRSAGDLLTGERYEVDCRYRTAGGVYRWQSCRARPQYNAAGQIEAWYGISVDIEDQRQVGQALRRSEEQLQWVAEAVGVGFWSWTGTNPPRVTFDATAAAMFGLPSNDPLPGDDVLQRIHPDDRSYVATTARRSISTGERLELEYRLLVPGRADVRWIASRGTVVADEDRDGASVPGMAGVQWDITARKAAEVERTQLLESERAARLDAERASRLKDDFLSTVSHELRTPLNAIVGWSRVLLRHAAGSDAELAEGLHVIDRNARAQTKLVEDLLDMSRITAGRLTIDPRPIDLRETLSAAVASVALAARNKGVAIDLQIETPTLRLIGDPDRLQQVAWNLLSNAVKFTPAGGQIVVAAGHSNGRTHFAVRDTGEGFTESFAHQIFDPFSQSDNAGNRSRKGGGLGLGLSIARNLVELHGGTLTAESPGPGRGATFTVELPTAGTPHGASRQTGPARSRAAMELRGISVLFVDDDADTRLLVARLLTDAGATVRTAASADDADRLLDEARPAVLISDIGLPDVDGYALLRRLRSRPAGQGGDLPAIAVTAFTRPEDRTQALRAGFQLHLAKPIDPTELIAAVASLATQWSSPAHTATPLRSPN